MIKKVYKCDVTCSLPPLPLPQTVTPSRTSSPSSVTYFMDGPIDGPCAVMLWSSGATPVCCLAAIDIGRSLNCGPCTPTLDGPFRRTKNGTSQMRRPAQKVGE